MALPAPAEFMVPVVGVGGGGTMASVAAATVLTRAAARLFGG